MTDAPAAAGDPDAGTRDGGVRAEPATEHLSTLLVAGVVAAGLALGARSGAVELLVAIAVTQALVVLSWVFATAAPGRIGQLIIGGLAGAGADVAVSVWPHGRLGTLLIVFGLALSAAFAHQLLRGAARARIVESVGGTALLVLAVVGITALLQLRHEFSGSAAAGAGIGGDVVAGVVVAAGGALVLGHLIDQVYAAPRFDVRISRGLLALVGSIGLGASLGHLLLRSHAEFANGRGALAGLAVGAIVGLLAVAVAFVLASPEAAPGPLGRRLRPVLAGTLPLALLAPAAFLLGLVIRT